MRVTSASRSALTSRDADGLTLACRILIERCPLDQLPPQQRIEQEGCLNARRRIELSGSPLHCVTCGTHTRSPFTTLRESPGNTLHRRGASKAPSPFRKERANVLDQCDGNGISPNPPGASVVSASPSRLRRWSGGPDHRCCHRQQARRAPDDSGLDQGRAGSGKSGSSS
jgi:hypothetical protein